MSEIITYQNDLSAQFCQIKLDDGKKILISVGNQKAVVYLLIFGFLPLKKMFEVEAFNLLTNSFYVKTLQKMIETSKNIPKFGFNQLEVMTTVLKPCRSIEEINKILSKFY